MTLTAATTKTQLQTVTDETGTFRFSGLPQGLYSVAYSIPGFRTAREDVAVVDGESLKLKARMEVASTAEEVTISSEAPPADKKAESREMQNAQAPRQAPARNAAPKALDAAGAVADQRKQDASRGPGVGSGAGRGGARNEAAAPPPPPPSAAPPAAGFRLDRPNFAFNTEAYDRIEDNPFRSASKDPLATFSIDVDTASYTNVRRFLNQGQLPPKDAVRIEELINYFNYDYADPSGRTPIAVHDRSRCGALESDSSAGAHRHQGQGR